MELTNEQIIYGSMILIGSVLVLTLIIYLIVSIRSKKKEEKLKIEVDVEKPNKELETVLKKMEEDLETRDVTQIKTFEDEQESKSIISYEELLSKTKSGQDKVEEEKLKIEVEEEKPNKELTKENKTLEDRLEKLKFKNSEVISPIFGKVKKEEEVKIKEEKKEQAEEIDIEETEYEGFLENLKKIRNNL